MTDTAPESANSRRSRISRLAKSLGKPGFRHGYMARQLKAFLAQQIRELRGDRSQTEFGNIIGKPQSVVSRLEKQADRQISVQTLIDIAERLDIAVIIRFVDFPTFFRLTDDQSDAALAPARYDQTAIDQLAAEQTGISAPGIPTSKDPVAAKPPIPANDPPVPTDPQVVTRPIPLRVIDGGKGKAEPQKPSIEAPPQWGVDQSVIL